MKITFVMAGGFSLSGGDRVIALYAERLQRRGHQITVVASPPPGPTLRQHLRSLRRTGGFASNPSYSESHFTNSPVPHRRLEKMRPVRDADIPDAEVVIATWWETAEWVAKLSPEKGAKVYFLQGYEALPYQPKHRVDATWRLPMHKITVSSWLLNKAREQFGDHDVSLVMNSVDTDQFYAPSRNRNTTPTVGMLYSEAPSKGVGLAIDVVEQVRKEFPDLKLVTFGSGLSPQVPLPEYASHSVHPPQMSIKDLYAQCDVWLCASLSEGFNLPALESMACRTPVVSTRVGAVPELITNGVQGYVAPVGDVEALIQCVKKVLHLTKSDWLKMSDAAYRTARGYTWDDATDLFEAALFRAAAQARSVEGPTKKPSSRRA